MYRRYRQRFYAKGERGEEREIFVVIVPFIFRLCDMISRVTLGLDLLHARHSQYQWNHCHCSFALNPYWERRDRG